MSERKRPEAPRGEKVLPGVWRLRLALPWPGVPHGNVWAVAADGGIVLFDTGIGGKGRHAPASTSPSPRPASGSRTCSLLVCTHSHTDHYGLAAPIVEAAGCELWMHPAWEHVRLLADDPAAALEQRIEVARQSGVPPAALERYRECAQRRHRDRDRRDRRARPRPAARGRGRDRPRHLAGPRDARPRALPRRPPPARAQAADLRRPPARPHRPLLRPRPLARPGRRVPARPRRGRAARGRPRPARPRPALPRPRGEDRRGAAPGRRADRQGQATRWPRGRRPPSRSSARSSAPRTSTRRSAPGCCRSSSPASTTWRSSARSSAVEGTDPQRWAPPVACRAMASFTIVREIAAPPETIFEVLVDHRALPEHHPAAQVRARAGGGAGAQRGRRDPRARRGRPAAARGSPRLRGAEPLLLQAALGAAGPRPRRHGRADRRRTAGPR